MLGVVGPAEVVHGVGGVLPSKRIEGMLLVCKTCWGDFVFCNIFWLI